MRQVTRGDRNLTLYSIGEVGMAVGMLSGTVRSWEHKGVIAEPRWRSGSQNIRRRVYTDGERDLISSAHALWLREHGDTVVPPPSLWRFGQIYWNLRDYSYLDSDEFLIFQGDSVPVDLLSTIPVVEHNNRNLLEISKVLSALLRDRVGFGISVQERWESQSQLFHLGDIKRILAFVSSERDRISKIPRG